MASTTRAPRVGAVRYLRPAGLLDVGEKRITDHAGHLVEVTQPYGCPRNGLHRQCYVNCTTCTPEDAKRPFFVGMVNLASLLTLREAAELVKDGE